MTAMLDGLTVVEGSAFVAAPSGGMTLAQLGADVIRFDQIGGGIDHGRWPLTDDGVSLYWASLNKAKRSIAVDLRSDEGRELVRSLVLARGVFLSNFPNRGPLGYDRLVADRPDLIMVSISGSHDGTTAVDYTVNCAVGYPDVTGPVDATEPVNHVLPAWDVICGQMAVIGVLGAERHRQRTGEGQLVRLALSDVALATVANLGHVAEAQVLGTQRERYGNQLYGAFGSDFATLDGRRVMVVAISAKQWESLLAATHTTDGVHRIETDLGFDFADEGDRFRARRELVELMAPWFGARTLAEVAQGLDAHGVCWGPYQSFLQLLDEDPRCSEANPLFQTVHQPGVGPYLAPGSPLRFGAAPDGDVAPAPVLGQHTDEVLAEVLGLGTAEIGRLHDRGVVAGAEEG